MKRIRAVVIAAVATLALSTPSTAQDRVFDLIRPAERERPVQVRIAWDSLAGRKSFKVDERITKGRPVSLHIVHFNYLVYTPVVTTEAEVIEAYQSLEKLWQQFVRLPTGPAAAAPTPSAFIDALKAWREELVQERKDFRGILAQVPVQAALDTTQREVIAGHRARVQEAMASLEDRRAEAYELILEVTDANNVPINAYYQQQLFNTELEIHRDLMEKLQSFSRLGGDVRNGRVFEVGSHAAGTLVTSSVALRENVGDAAMIERPDEIQRQISNAGTLSIQHFVHSDLPVILFAGPSYTRIDQLDVERVEVPGQGDLFRQIDNPEGDADLIAFLGYELGTTADGRGGLLASIGTNVASFGERLYFGVTGKFERRLFVTVGGVTQEMEAGEKIYEGDLYRSFREVRKLGFFFSIGMSPF